MKTMVLLSFVLILIFFSSCSNSNDSSPTEYDIYGQVIDAISGISIKDVSIITIPATASIFTDSLGNYRIHSILNGNYTVIAKKYGYKPDSVQITLFNHNIEANLQLLPASDTVQSSINDYWAFYRLNGDISDISQNHINGTDYSNTYSIDRFGNSNSALFCQNGKYAVINDNHQLDFSGNFSICSWINPNSSQTDDGYGNIDIISKWTDYGINNSSYSLCLQKDFSIGVAFYNGLTSQINTHVLTPDKISVNTWSHLAMVLKGNLLSIYIDGNLSISTYVTDLPQSSNYPLSIGTRGNKACYFNGAIDDIYFFKRDLTATEVKLLAH